MTVRVSVCPSVNRTQTYNCTTKTSLPVVTEVQLSDHGRVCSAARLLTFHVKLFIRARAFVEMN